MARRQKEDGETVSLFPFLSILACVIGTLTLMIAGLALSQIDQGESPEALQRVADSKAIAEESESTREQIDEMLKKLAAAEKLVEELRLAEAEAARLAAAEESAKAAATAIESTPELARLAELRKRIPELKADLPKLDEQIAALRKQIEDKGKPREAEVVVKPGGTGIDLEPTFAEVTANDVVIYEGDEPERIRAGDLDRKDGRFHQLLDKIAGTPKGQLVFLLREDGLATYNRATAVCRTHYGPNGYCPHGKLPIVGQGKIDLKLFLAE